MLVSRLRQPGCRSSRVGQASQHRANLIVWRRRHLRIAEDRRASLSPSARRCLLPGLGNVDALQRRVIWMLSGIAVRHLPHEVHRSRLSADDAVWRFDDRQPCTCRSGGNGRLRRFIMPASRGCQRACAASLYFGASAPLPKPDLHSRGTAGGDTRDIANVGEAGAVQRDRKRHTGVGRSAKTVCVSGSYDAPGQLGCRHRAMPMVIAWMGPPTLRPRAAEHWSHAYIFTRSSASAHGRRVVDVYRPSLPVVRRLAAWSGTAASVRASPGNVALRHRALFDRPHGLTGDTVEDVEERLLCSVQRPDGAAIHRARQAAVLMTGRSPRSDDARPGSATCARRSSPDRRRPANRQTGYCRADDRRIGRRWIRRPGKAGPASSSTVICVHTPALPLDAHESFSHVSLPNSPGRGIVLNARLFAGAHVEGAGDALRVVVRRDLRAFLERRPDGMTSFCHGRRRMRPISPVSRSIG